MSQAKTERLVNLTMALLASRRYLRKSEIFEKVAGYSGTAETKERMFERDKDDLRALGIEIEVSSQDPLFEDEPGYRIRPESYQLPLGNFSPLENALIITALNLWESSEFENEANAAVRRMDSRSVSSLEIFPELVRPNELFESGLMEVTKALAARSRVEFDYRKTEGQNVESRRVNPFGLSTWQGSWYLVGEDLDRNDIRVFRLSRIISRISVSNRREMYEIPSDFNVKDYLIMLKQDSLECSWRVKKDQGQTLRIKADSITSLDDEWDLVKLSVDSYEEVVKLGLWNFDCAVLLTPIEARLDVVKLFEKVSKAHA